MKCNMLEVSMKLDLNIERLFSICMLLGENIFGKQGMSV